MNYLVTEFEVEISKWYGKVEDCDFAIKTERLRLISYLLIKWLLARPVHIME